MLKKKNAMIIIVFGVILALLVLIVSIFTDIENIRSASRISTLIFGLAFALIGSGVGTLYKIKSIEKIPGRAKQIEIEYEDERNKFIRDKAKAQAGEISNWFVLLIAYICIIMNYSIWLTLFIFGVFLLKYIIEIVFIKKYNKEI